MSVNTQNIHKYEEGNAIVIGVIALAVLVVGGFFLIPEKDTAPQVEEVAVVQEETQRDGDTTMVAEGGDTAMMEAEGTSAAPTTQLAGSYEEYTPEKLAFADSGDVVLFFHATWCPSCRAADKAISNASNIPAGLTILKLDYDEETELRKKYKLTTQHSFVQVDSQGNLVKKWIGSASVADVQAQVI